MQQPGIQSPMLPLGRISDTSLQYLRNASTGAPMPSARPSSKQEEIFFTSTNKPLDGQDLEAQRQDRQFFYGQFHQRINQKIQEEQDDLAKQRLENALKQEKVIKDTIAHADSQTSQRWLLKLYVLPAVVGDESASQQQPAYRLICMPYAGGSSKAYRSWRFTKDRGETYAVEPPGRMMRWKEPYVQDLHEMVQAIIKALDDFGYLPPPVAQEPSSPSVSLPPSSANQPTSPPPLILVGYSLGALLAYEVARYLKLHRRWDPLAIVVGGCKPPHARQDGYNLDMVVEEKRRAAIAEQEETLRQRKKGTYGGGDKQRKKPFVGSMEEEKEHYLCEYLSSFGWFPAMYLAYPKQMIKPLIPLFRADAHVIHRYSFAFDDFKVQCPVLAFGIRLEEDDSAARGGGGGEGEAAADAAGDGNSEVDTSWSPISNPWCTNKALEGWSFRADECFEMILFDKEVPLQDLSFEGGSMQAVSPHDPAGHQYNFWEMRWREIVEEIQYRIPRWMQLRAVRQERQGKEIMDAAGDTGNNASNRDKEEESPEESEDGKGRDEGREMKWKA